MKKSILIFAASAALFSAASCNNLLDVPPQNSLYEEQIQDLLVNGTDEQRQAILKSIGSNMAVYYNNWAVLENGGVQDPCTYCAQAIDWGRSLMCNDVVLHLAKQGIARQGGEPFYDGTSDYQNGYTAYNWCHWNLHSNSINKANTLLNYMTPAVIAASNMGKDGAVRGLCVRAFSYMSLMEDYCLPYDGGGKDKLGLSIYRKYDPGQEPEARKSADSTWNFIISDLEYAQTLAKAEGIGYTHGYANMEDFDLGLVQFLLARAYLLHCDYAKCAAVCEEMVANGGYDFIAPENYGCNPEGKAMTCSDGMVLAGGAEFYPENNAFTAMQKNPEVILGYSVNSAYNPGDNTNIARYHTRLVNPFGYYASRGGCPIIDGRLYTQIADNDVRKNGFYPQEISGYAFFGDVTGYNIPAYAAMKFGATFGINATGDGHILVGDTNDQEFCKFRYSEVVLMLAEAYAKQNNDAKAKDALNKLLAARTMPGKPALTCDTYPAMSGKTALQMVQLQYRIELWGENGREYYNNRRWQIDTERQSAGSTHEGSGKNVSYAWNKLVIHFPKNEIETNPNLVEDITY